MPLQWTAIAAGVMAILTPVLFGLYDIPAPSKLTSPVPSLCPSNCPSNTGNTHSGYFGYECAGKPHHSSWTSWWHPQRSNGDQNEHNQGAGTITEDWNILYHLGGNGPWVEKVIDVVEGGIAPPQGCKVEQVHMMSRHAERYPTKKAGKTQRAVVERMKQSGRIFTGNLAFLNNWQLFWSPDDTDLEQLTSTGPFSGTLGAFTTGVRLRTRYKHLIDHAATTIPDRPTTFWASDSNRVIETAKHFASGFFGIEHHEKRIAALEVISEHFSQGANTLTPGRTCLANKRDHKEGQRKGYRLMKKYLATYLHATRARLLEQTGMHFSDKEIYAMQEMCGFETTVRGRSDWCDVFTQEEFLSFEYARDVLHYYRAGPGQKYAASMGWLWLNATTNLLVKGPDAGTMFFSFVHDGDIAPLLTALDILPDPLPLPTTHIARDRKWRKSQVSPMGGRIIFELLSCNSQIPAAPAKFIRVNINDGVTAIPDCQNGPGGSCPLGDFARRTRSRGEVVGGFAVVCGLAGGKGDVCDLAEGKGNVYGLDEGERQVCGSIEERREEGITFLHQ